MGVAHHHREEVVDDASAYSVFFAMLEAQPVECIHLARALSREPLEPLDALLIGGPRDRLSAAEVSAVSSWVRRGGHLLLLAPALTERRSPGDVDGTDVLGQLVSGLQWSASSDDPRHVDEVMAIDVSALLQRRALLVSPGCYVIEPRSPLARAYLPHEPVQLAVGSGPLIRDGAPWRIHRAVPVDRERCYALLQMQYGRGAICVFASVASISDTWLRRGDNAAFAAELLRAWLPPGVMDHELARRQQAPPRHHLLQGYPLPRLMEPQESPGIRRAAIPGAPSLDHRRPLVVRVAPHAISDPRAAVYGYRPYPRPEHAGPRARAVVERVMTELRAVTATTPELGDRPVSGLHIGDGAVELTPPESFRALCATLADVFDLRSAGVTIEGAPSTSASADRHAGLFDILHEELPARHHRVSLRVKTFAGEQLARIGRPADAHREQVAAIVTHAHRRGMSVSGDLLFNLPGQPRQQMLADVRMADELGFDQICLHHPFDGLGAPWSQNPELLARMPGNRPGLRNWMALRRELSRRGFVQRTLTRFVRAGGSPEAAQIASEDYAARPESHDALGFGPGSVSLLANMDEPWAVKTGNHADAHRYMAAVDRTGHGRASRFCYDLADLKLLYVTAKLPLLTLDRLHYWKCFASPLDEDFRDELEALCEAELIEERGLAYALTPRGVFYADAVFGLLTWRQAQIGRTRKQLESAREVSRSYRRRPALHNLEQTAELPLG